MDGISSTVIGVMPVALRVERKPELWVPVGQRMLGRTAERGNHPGLTGIDRLKRGVSFGEGRIKSDGAASGFHPFRHTGLGTCESVVAQHGIGVRQSGAG